MATKSLEALREELIACGPIPRHVAVIMDGNGRWAKDRGQPRIFGHQAGRKPVREVVEGCRELGIEALTLYTFSIENWQRPAMEIKALMAFLEATLREEKAELKQNGIRLGVIGRPQDLPAPVRKALDETIAELAGGSGMLLNLALSYGGRTEIVDAARAIAEDAAAGKLDPALLSEAAFADRLYTADIPDPDLLIRTSGEMRLSNFLLWQLAYAEIWVTELYWPDFRKEHLFLAVRDFQRRDRRFGKVT
ncbi:MAG: isoprenyl transferase [Candidatus Eisenbacteria bacterium]|nr:isoprenyl transferase [Candidatus Eisenbacteria bacterium]